MGRVCDVMEILQSRLATATSRPPVRDIRDTVNPPRGFDQSAMLTSYRVWDYKKNHDFKKPVSYTPGYVDVMIPQDSGQVSPLPTLDNIYCVSVTIIEHKIEQIYRKKIPTVSEQKHKESVLSKH